VNIKADIMEICYRDIQGIYVTQNSDQTLDLVLSETSPLRRANYNMVDMQSKHNNKNFM